MRYLALMPPPALSTPTSIYYQFACSVSIFLVWSTVVSTLPRGFYTVIQVAAVFTYASRLHVTNTAGRSISWNRIHKTFGSYAVPSKGFIPHM